MKNIILLLLSINFCYSLSAQEVNIIPQPISIKLEQKNPPFILNNQTQIIAADSLINSVSFLKNYVKKYYNVELRYDKDLQYDLEKESDSTKNKNVIKLGVSGGFDENLDKYQLSTNHNYVALWSSSSKGLFYGVQTLIQLLPPQKSATLAIPSLSITDYPRFAYRGMHLDVSRHFFDVAFIKKYIDYLALHKMNYFHWHLTDDHGWRIEIKKYPKLTEVGAWRNGSIIGLWPGKGNEGVKYQVLPKDVVITPKNATIKTDNVRYGGYYTQREITDVVKYAAERYITIIPEIEMPAHSMALLAAYPELGTEPHKKYTVAETWGMMNKYNNVLQPSDTTFKFLENVLTEVMDLFPSPYIHIGGDEASKIWWRKSAESQALIKKYGLKDENELQSYLIQRIEKFVNSKGKTIIGWNEILQGGLAPNAVVMSWQGEKGGIAAAKANHKVIMTPEEKLYFNHSQFLKDDSLTAAKHLPLKTVYDYDPVPAELDAEQASYIWGAQGNLWSEYIANPAKAEYMIFPRLDALSEILWSPKDKRNYPDFLKRLETQFKRYDLMNIGYSKRYLSKEYQR